MTTLNNADALAFALFKKVSAEKQELQERVKELGDQVVDLMYEVAYYKDLLDKAGLLPQGEVVFMNLKR